MYGFIAWPLVWLIIDVVIDNVMCYIATCDGKLLLNITVRLGNHELIINGLYHTNNNKFHVSVMTHCCLHSLILIQPNGLQFLQSFMFNSFFSINHTIHLQMHNMILLPPPFDYTS